MEGILKSPGPGQEKGLPGDCSTMRQEPLGVCGDSRQSGRGPMGVTRRVVSFTDAI